MVTRVGFWDGEIYYGDDEDYVPYEEYEELQAERDALKADAERYWWLRQRIEVRNERVMSGAFRRCIGTRIGASVIDAPLPFTATPAQREAKMQELDAAIDAARGE